VELIRRALTIGFSLPELKTILAVRDKGGAPCRHVRDLLRSKIHNLDQRLKNLVSLRAEMHRLSKEWDKRFRRTEPGQVAQLLDNVPSRSNGRVVSCPRILPKKKGL
jgi:DNA-binding transcriptional MerR regulator